MMVYLNKKKTLDRLQSKTLYISIDERGSKHFRNSVFYCTMSPIGGNLQLKTLFLTLFDPLSKAVSEFSVAVSLS